MSSMNIPTKRDLSAVTTYEQALIDFMNLENRAYIVDRIHASELVQCLRQAATNHFFETEFDLFDDFLEMWLGKSCHWFIGNTKIISGWPDQRYQKSFRGVKETLTGEIDLETNRGLFEIKTKSTFMALPYYDPNQYPQFNFPLVSYYAHKSKNKGPHGSHVDQGSIYLQLTNRGLFFPVYISKTQNEGIAAYRVFFDKRDEKDREIYRNNLEIIKNRMTSLGEVLRKLESTDKKDYGAIANVINKLPAEPSGLCGYCTFGAYREAKHKKGLKSPTNEMEEFFYNNGCSVPIEDRGVTGHRWKPAVLGFPTLKRDLSGTVVDGFIYDSEKTNDLYKGIIDFSVKHILVPYNTKYLFECTRRTHYFNKYPDLFTLFMSSEDVQKLIIWYWFREAVKQYFIDCISSEKLEDSRVFVENVVAKEEVEVDVLTMEGTETQKVIYRERVYFIDSAPTLIVPTTEVFHPELPFDTHKKHLILYKYWFPDTVPQVIYIPFKRPNKYADNNSKTAHLNVFSLSKIAKKDVADAMNDIRLQIRKAERFNEVQPNIWCYWCPILNARLPSGAWACPEGQEFLESKRKTRVSMIKDVPISVDIPIGEPRETEFDDSREQMIW